ncbi:MAG: OmpA family protein [Roseomonas sp.]|nr:OmpA family protein [Roseomonas sp.]
MKRGAPSFTRRAGLAAGFALLSLAARAQASDPSLPPDPAPAPPPPVQLTPLRPQIPQSPAGQLPGLQALPEGGFRLRMTGTELTPAQATAVQALARTLAALPQGRITVEAQVAGPAEDVSAARRLSLARAQAVKSALVAGGLTPTRIDLRPLGRLSGAQDAVDILPPGVASPNTEARRS